MSALAWRMNRDAANHLARRIEALDKTNEREQPMAKEPLYHETARGRFGIPGWWFGAPVVAFAYVLATPRFLPDLVAVPAALPSNLASPLRWFVGLLIGVALLTIVQLLLRIRRRKV
jgi:hypothetical protein